MSLYFPLNFAPNLKLSKNSLNETNTLPFQLSSLWPWSARNCLPHRLRTVGQTSHGVYAPNPGPWQEFTWCHLFSLFFLIPLACTRLPLWVDACFVRTVKQADAVLSEPRVRAGLLGLKKEGAGSLWATHEGETGANSTVPLGLEVFRPPLFKSGWYFGSSGSWGLRLTFFLICPWCCSAVNMLGLP